jgi:hypothetical protein
MPSAWPTKSPKVVPMSRSRNNTSSADYLS